VTAPSPLTVRPVAAGRDAVLPVVVAVLVAAVAWELLVLWSDGWVPSIIEIVTAVGAALTDGTTWSAAAVTARRLLIAFIGSLILGLLLGLAMGLSQVADAVLRPLLVLALATPDPVYFTVALLVFGLGESSGLIALTLAVTPFVVTIIAGALARRESGLDDVAIVYQVGAGAYLRRVLGPQVAPALLAAARTAFAFSWKIVVLMEALTQPDGVGSEIYYAFRLLQPDRMIALAVIFIVLMRTVEVVVFGRIERRALAWRR
jgi:NitT/TauT family transport system permease protein